ncbi:Bacterial SH3 domain [Micromonospora narathiwatensis]|uniref:Bacterial SH3 domain n=2 Tax=Micromonospora narathiwatensis TaxID=299146 RepID=A0A1A8Z1Z9_9ACTN|nr:Bacterial SH3 domain [Micromonospora narathiwatensis]
MPNLDDGYDSVLGAGSTGLALRTGPHVSCGLILRIPEGRIVGLQCYQQGDVVNQVPTWSAVNFQGNPGWVSDAYLKRGGSYDYCGDEGW